MSKRTGSILKDARIYLSGPMDFLLARKWEKKYGWRSRVGKFLKSFGAIVYDPWSKPIILGQENFGQNYEYSAESRAKWLFDNTESGRRTRAELCHEFYPTVHINMRMVDICDFIIAYCPTNIYSVGTVNEIIRARAQNKPVLLVSPPIEYPSADELKKHLEQHGDEKALALLEKLKEEVSLKENPNGTPSPWYLGLLDEDYFFDGFGFHLYPEFASKGKASGIYIDEIEIRHKPKRCLLPYLDGLNKALPKRYDLVHQDYVENTDWIILQPRVHEIID